MKSTNNSVPTRTMKTFQIILLAAALSTVNSLPAAEAGAGNAAKADDPKPTGSAPEKASPPRAAEELQSPPAAKPAVETAPSENGGNLLRMNFRGASLDQVLNYLSEAAGFIINIK